MARSGAGSEVRSSGAGPDAGARLRKRRRLGPASRAKQGTGPSSLLSKGSREEARLSCRRGKPGASRRPLGPCAPRPSAGFEVGEIQGSPGPSVEPAPARRWDLGTSLRLLERCGYFALPGRDFGLVTGVEDLEPTFARGSERSEVICQSRHSRARSHRLPAIRIGLGRKRSSRAPAGGETRVPDPRIAASTKPAVAVPKPRKWCR